MPSRQSLPSTLTKARQQLQKAQSRVAALEAQLVEGTPPLVDLAGTADRYHRTLDTMLEGCQLIGFDWRYLYINDTAAHHGQRTKDELLGYTMIERYPGIEQTALFAVLQRCMQERQIERIEHEFTYPDGTAAWFELSVQPVPEGIFILSLDITARKQAEEKIHQLHRTLGVLSDINQAIVRIRHLPSLFEKVCEIAVEKGAFRLAWIGLFDPKTGRIDSATSAGIAASDLEKIISLLSTPPLLPALRAGERLLCNDLQTDAKWLALRAEALRLGCRATVALPLLVAGEIRGIFNLYAGETAFFDAQEMRLMDEMAGDISFAIEVAEQEEQRLNAESALRLSEEKYRTLIESSESVIAVFDREGTFLFANRIAAAGLGLTPATLIGRKMAHLFPPPTVQDQLARIRQVIQTGEGTIYEAIRVVLGEARWYRSSIQPIRDVSGEITSALVNAMDITHLKRAEADLRNERDTLEQKVAERTADLQAALGRVEAILHNSPDAILLVNADLAIQQTNQSFNTLFGATWNEDLGQSLRTLFHPDDVHTINNLPTIAPAQQNGYQLEVRAIRKDGTTFDAELNIGVIKDDGLVCIIRDITERKAQERQLRYQAALQENVSDAVIVTDMQLRIQSWNQAAVRMYGWTAAEASGKVAPDFLQIRFSPATNLASAGKQFNKAGFLQQETIQRRKDGTDIFILGAATRLDDEKGVPVGVIAINHDITELQQAQRAITESEVRYRLLAENISDVIAKMNPDGICTFITPSCYALLGYTPAELIGQPSIDIIHPDDRPNALAAVMQAVSDKKTNFSFISRYRHKAGHDLWAEVTNNLIYDGPTEKLVEIIGVIRDISARKLAEVEVREAEHRYHALFEQAHDAVFLLDMQGNHIESNHRAADMLGYRIEELQTLSFREISDEIPESTTVLERLLAGESVPMYERVMRKRDGSRIAVEINVEIVRDLAGQPRHIQSVVRDITARKRVAESLRESEERFRCAIIDAPFPIMIHADNGEVLHISNAWAEISGYTHAEIPTMAAWIAKAYRENSQIVRPLIEKVYTLRKPRRGGEFQIWTKAGEERIWDFISAPLAAMPDGRRMVSSMAMDITDRKHAEEALQNKMAEERQFQLYLKALHEIIIELTGIDQLDMFYKRAVELGRERLGFERLAMFLYDERDDSAIGTYGTDTQGKLVDERGVRFTPDPHGVMQRSFEQVERFYVMEETTLYNDVAPVGHGWNAAAALWNGRRNLGWFVADNLLHHGPAAKPLLDTLGLYALSVGTLLAQKQTQLALKESEALYRLLAENISDLIIRSTLTSECLYVSPSVQTLLGYTPAELIGQQTFNLIHPDDQPILWAAYASALERKDLILPHQYRARHKAGHYIWLETVGKPLFQDGSDAVLEIITSSRDISARKQAEAAVRESEARYRLLAENLADIIMTFSLDRQITYISPSCEKLLGYLPAEVEGKAQSEFIPPEDYGRVVARTRQAVVAKEDSYTNEFRLRHKAGHYIWYEVRTRIVRESQTGNIVQFVSVLRDITERKEGEDALRESEEKFRLLLDAAPVATIISDPAGRITLVNGQAESLFGYRRSELTGQLVEVLVPDYTSASHLNNRMTYLATPRVRPMGLGLELYAKCKGGREVPVEIELSYINTRDGTMVMSFIMDITERKRIAAELEQQRSFLRNVIDVSPSMIFVKDYDGRFVLVNPSVAAIYNTTIDALIGKTDADFNPILKEVDDFLAADRLVITSGEIRFIEEPITNFTGKTHWLRTTKVPIVSADGKSKYVLGVSTDITERKEAEEALQASEEKYRSLVETMRGGLAVFDPEFRMTFVNDRFCELVGYARAEVIGQLPLHFVDAADLPLVHSHLERRQRAESTTYEIPIRHKDGHQIYLLMSGSPLLDQQGKYNGSIVVATDITIQKQAEATLRQALAKEKELGELKTRFVSMASHEFRTPLATILAVVETLSIYRHKLSAEQIDKRFDKIKDQVGHLKDIMEDVLMLARMQARHVEFNPVPLDLAALLRSVLDEFQSQAESKHQLEYIVDEELHEILLDRKLMRQLISNLVSNAIKYSPAETVVRIQLAYGDAEVILTVSDQGIGIPEADLPHLFEPFHRAANVGTISGTGLGLVITREAVELHGGTITVESQQGVGTTFHVRIPISAGDNPLSLAEAAPPATAAPS